MIPLSILQQPIEGCVGCFILEVAAQIGRLSEERPKDSLVDGAWLEVAAPGQEAMHHIGKVRSPLFGRKLRVIDTDEYEFFGQQASGGEIVERGDHKSF